MKYTPTLAHLIDALRCLPGVGPKSAQRMAFYLLERDRDGGRVLAQSLADALNTVGHCTRCRMLTEAELCTTCASDQRDVAQLCVVESPADVVAIEQRELTEIVSGRLALHRGVGGENHLAYLTLAELGLDQFEGLLGEGEVREVILATNPTVEGEATAHYLGELALRWGLKVSRIAHGVPVGGELEYVDGGTLAHALAGRTAVS
jgi:recombination protein RecR